MEKYTQKKYIKHSKKHSNIILNITPMTISLLISFSLNPLNNSQYDHKLYSQKILPKLDNEISKYTIQIIIQISNLLIYIILSQ